MESFGGAGEITRFTSNTVKVFDNPMGPEVYAEGPHSTFSASGNVTISLYAPRHMPDGEVCRAIVVRLTMPVHGAHALAVGLFDYLKKAGLVPESQGGPAGPTMAN